MKNTLIKAVFLDRDGVINYDKGHVGEIDRFEFIHGTIEALKIIQKKGYVTLVVTNQSGIGKGLYTNEDFSRLTEYMNYKLVESGVKELQVFYCPYHPDGTIKKYKKDSYFRKPNPGMIEKAVNDLKIDSEASFMVGDNYSDIIAGKRAKIGTNILLKSDIYVEDEQIHKPDHIFKDLNEFAKWLN